MGNHEADAMMALLQELSMLKNADGAFEDNPTESEREAYQLRQKMRDEIGVEIKALAEQEKKAEQTASENLYSRFTTSPNAATWVVGKSSPATYDKREGGIRTPDTR